MRIDACSTDGLPGIKSIISGQFSNSSTYNNAETGGLFLPKSMVLPSDSESRQNVIFAGGSKPWFWRA